MRLSAALGLIGLVLLAPASEAGDVELGRALAARWCADCHDVGPGGAMKREPPSFAAIAVYRAPHQIRSRILVPHQGMPELASVLDPHMDDLIAYIVSLEASATGMPGTD